jgi:hypothetical protein
MPATWFQGFDADHNVSHITIEGLTLNGNPIETLDQARIAMNPHVHDVTFRAN